MPSQRVGQYWKPAAPRWTLAKQAIIQLEEDPVFDAGVGAHLNQRRQGSARRHPDGWPSLQSGAIAAVERIRNPIHLARLILEKGEHSFLVGAGAEQFAV